MADRYRNQNSRQGNRDRYDRGRDMQRDSQRTKSTKKKKAALIKEKKEVRRHVIFTGVLMSVAFGAMIVYLLVYTNVLAEELFENDYNRRQEILLSQNIRGKIYSSDGYVLAETITDEEGNDVRSYPYANMFAHIVGYTYKGGSGVELLEDYELSQSDISLSEKAYYDSVNEKYPANDVYTTLDFDLQQAAYEALGDEQGAIIVTDVNTGAILAMVSKPDFDPNTIEEDWDSFGDDPDAATLLNRASQGLYAPGSTFKIFDVVEFLTEDINNASSFSFTCEGYTTIEDIMINCYHWTAHGTQDLESAFADSCNSAFVTIGYSLDRDSFNDTLSTMLFGEELPYDLSSGTSSYDLTDETTTEDVLQLAIGQGATLMTPMHLNMITDAIANGGTVYKHQIVSYIATGTGTTLSNNKAEAYRTVMSEEIAEYLRDYMRAVVTEGTGSKLSSRPYNAAGKTGSAEYVDGESASHAWFTGFAPYEDPEIAITVIVEGAGSGGTAAVPVAMEVLDAYFGYTATDDDDDDTYSYVSIAGEEEEEEEDPSEGTTVSLNVDTDGDGVYDALDTNGDGIPEAYDLDGDGIPESSLSASEVAAAEAEALAQAAAAEAAAAAQAEVEIPAEVPPEDLPADGVMDPLPDTAVDGTVPDTTTDTAAEDATDTTTDTTTTEETTDTSDATVTYTDPV